MSKPRQQLLSIFCRPAGHLRGSASIVTLSHLPPSFPLRQKALAVMLRSVERPAQVNCLPVAARLPLPGNNLRIAWGPSRTFG